MEIKTIFRRKKNQNDETSVDESANSELMNTVVLSENHDSLDKADLKALKHLARDYEKSIEYYNMKTHPGRTMWLGLLSGMARGFGFAIGFTLLTLLFVYFLQGLVDIPIIGDFIAELLVYIEDVRSIPY